MNFKHRSLLNEANETKSLDDKKQQIAEFMANQHSHDEAFWLNMINKLKDIANQFKLKAIDFDKVIDSVDVEQIKKGIEVEKEHTNSLAISLIISLHHLDEHKTYYTILLKNNL